MDIKCPCGQRFVAPGVEAGARVACPACGRESAAEREAPPAPRRSGPVPVPCDRCGRGGAREAELMRVVSFVLWTRRRRWRETLCPPCVTRAALAETFLSGWLGWWGIPWGPLLTPVAIAVNARSLATRSDLPGPFGVMAALFVALLPFTLLAFAAGWLPAGDGAPPPKEPPVDPVAELMAERAEAALRGGDAARAAALCDELRRRAPGRPGLAGLAGRAYLAANRNEDAAQQLRAAGERTLLAEALLALGRADEALAELTDESPELRAPILARLEQFAGAAAIEPAGPRSKVAVAFARARLGRWEGARRAADTPEARVALERARGCLKEAARHAIGDDAAWLALDRGDLAEARARATDSPRGALAAAIAGVLDGSGRAPALRPGDDEPALRAFVAFLRDRRLAPVAWAAMHRQPAPVRVLGALAWGVALRDAGDESGARRYFERAALEGGRLHPGGVLAGRLAGREVR